MSKSTMTTQTKSADTNAIAALKKDHAMVKQLFDQFEETESSSEKEEIIEKAIQELKLHATVEEEIFYPALRGGVEDEDMMNEAEQEHHVARVLIAELELNAKDEGRRNAKFMVLAESVRHHIKEEEGQIFPAAKELDIDFDELGRQMNERKQELMDEGVPPDAEHEMVSGAAGGRTSRTKERTTVAMGKSSRKSSAKEGSKDSKARKT